MAAKAGKKRACRQCGKKNAVVPAWLCYTCKRNNKKAAAEKRHGAHVEETYGITKEEYDALYRLQGGKCAICKRAAGSKRRLAVDHDHTKEGKESVRGLLCKLCNYYVLGRFARDQVEPLQNAIYYLQSPPAQKILDLLTDPPYERLKRGEL